MKTAMRMFVVVAMAGSYAPVLADINDDDAYEQANESVTYSSSEINSSATVARNAEADQQRQNDQMGAASGEPRDISNEELKERQRDDWIGSIWAPLP